MIHRRELLAGGGALLAALPVTGLRAALPVPAGNRLGFDVIRKGAKLGVHMLSFAPNGDSLTVQVAVDIVYKIGPITLYRYTHRAIERWQGEQVVSLESHTDDNGTKYQVLGHREAAGFVVEGTKARYVAPPDALPATHWNRRELAGPWINTQDGALMRPRIAQQGIDTIPTAGGGSTRARRFVLTGDVQMDMWYDDRPSWAGLAFVKGGVPVRYERQA
jgi:hypothetical protein